MSQSSKDDLEALVALSKDGSERARQRLFENITDIFTSPENRLNERERALITDILGKLIVETETSVRKQLAERLAADGNAPDELITLLANDKIEIARPILYNSSLLAEPDLIDIIRNRSKEHLMAVAQRDDISMAVSDLLIDYGDEDVISGLIENSDADISRESMDFLVEESRRVDRFQEPLLSRNDLPATLAHRMFWWVSAALRRHILEKFDIDELLLDETVSDTGKYMQSLHAARSDTHAEKLVRRVNEKGDLSERFLVQALKSKQIRIFSFGLALKAELGADLIERVIYDNNSEALAVICKALNFDRNSYSAVFLMTRSAHLNHVGGNPLDPAIIEKTLGFYDSLTAEKTEKTVRYWRIDNSYWQAVDDLAENRGRRKMNV